MTHKEIYSKTGSLGANLRGFRVPLKSLDTLKSTNCPLAFSYEFRDCTFGIELENAIDKEHWKNLSKYPQSIFIYSNCNEPTDCKDIAKRFKNILQLYNIRQTQIYIILTDSVQAANLQNEFYNLHMFDIHIDYKTVSVLDINLNDVNRHANIQPTKQFSIMSRRYVKDRLFLFCELAEKKLLNNFHYSFHNDDPYKRITIAPINEIKESLPLKYNTPAITQWIDNIPYFINNEYDDYGEQYSDKIYKTIHQSNFHITIETIFNEGIYSFNASNIAPWITEKTYKPIACKKIFLCYGMKGSLEFIRQLGFKTFDGIIDETYDTIDNPEDRRNALVLEIERLSNLNEDETIQLIDSAASIIEYNFIEFERQKEKKWSKHFKRAKIF